MICVKMMEPFLFVLSFLIAIAINARSYHDTLHSPYLPSHLPGNICNKLRGSVGVNPTSDVQAAAVVCGERHSGSVMSAPSQDRWRCHSRNEFLPVVRPCAVKGIKRGAPVLLLGFCHHPPQES